MKLLPPEKYIALLETKLERTEGQLDGEQESRLDTETRAAAAEAKLEVLEGRRPAMPLRMSAFPALWRNLFFESLTAFADAAVN